MENWFTCQMDVSHAFLHGELLEDVYMKMPPGYSHYGSRITTNSSSFQASIALVCKLLKSLYGLKQASRQWFAKLSLTLIHLGYHQSKTDYSLFIHHNSTKITLVLVYVDDLLICGNCMDTIDSLKKMLSSTFHMKDLGSLRYFLGWKLTETILVFLFVNANTLWTS